MANIKPQNINILYDTLSFNAKASRTARENTISDFHSYHKEHNGVECNGEIGMQFYCKKDNDITKRTDLKKGYDTGVMDTATGQTKRAYFTEEQIKSLESRAGIRLERITDLSKVDFSRVKETYILTPNTDGKKANPLDKAGYFALKQFLKDGNVMEAKAKMSSRGFKTDGEMSVIRYNAQYNAIELVKLYFKEEMNDGIEKVGDEVDEEIAKRAGQKIFGKAEKIDIDELHDTQTEKIFQQIQEKLDNPQAEEKTTAKKEMSEAEKELMKIMGTN